MKKILKWCKEKTWYEMIDVVFCLVLYIVCIGGIIFLIGYIALYATIGQHILWSLLIVDFLFFACVILSAIAGWFLMVEPCFVNEVDDTDCLFDGGIDHDFGSHPIGIF